MMVGHGSLWAWAYAWTYMHVAGTHEHGHMVARVYTAEFIQDISSYVWVQQARMAQVQTSIVQLY